MGKLVAGGFVTVSGPLRTYPGVALPREVMPKLADAIRQGKIPMNAHHDPRNRLDPKVRSVELKETDDGNLGVWVELEVREEEWEKHGHLGGFSISAIEPYVHPVVDGGPAIMIAADAAHFEDGQLLEAAAALKPHFSVRAGRLYQLAEIAEARVLIELAAATLQSVPSNLLASALYDALKSFLRRSTPSGTTDFNFKVTRPEGTAVEGAVRTSDEKHLKQVVDLLPDLARPEQVGKVLEFDAESRKWKELH